MNPPQVPSPLEVGQHNARAIFALVFVLIAIWLVAWLWARHPVIFICCLVVLAFGVASHVTQALATPPIKHKSAPAPPGPAGPGARPSAYARHDIPARYLAIYRAKSTARQCPGLSWTVLAGIGKVESDHGRSSAPGVRRGVNRFGCCAGPMQFNLTNGPPSTWRRYGRGGNPYDPVDAVPASARLLCSAGAPGHLRRAILAYNASGAYVDTVLTNAARYGTT